MSSGKVKTRLYIAQSESISVIKKASILLLLILLFAYVVIATVEDDFLILLNEERQRFGVPSLSINAELSQAANLHSQDMLENNYLSHTSLDGTRFNERIVQQGYTHYRALGENIAYHSGSQNAEQVFTMWRNSPGHYANMISSSFKEAGLGIASTTQRVYYTLDLGARSSTIPSPSLPNPPIINPSNTTNNTNTTIPSSQPNHDDPQYNADTTSPVIYRTGPMNGFNKGDFRIIFREQNPDKLIIAYGIDSNMLEKEFDIETNCIFEKLYDCKITTDVSVFNGQEILYYFNIFDKTGNFDTSRSRKIIIDTQKPLIILVNYTISRNIAYFSIQINEDNFDYLSYKNLNNGGRKIRICSRLRDGFCSFRVGLKAGVNPITFYAIDDAGGEMENSIEVTL